MRVIELPAEAGALVIVTGRELAVVKTAAAARGETPDALVSRCVRTALEVACASDPSPDP